MRVDNLGGGTRNQIFYSARNNQTYIRKRRGGSWSNWSEFSVDIPSFYKDYASISALATGMNGIIPKGNLEGSSNNVNETCIYTLYGNATDIPVSLGILVTIMNPTAQYRGIQVAFSRDITKGFYYRTKHYQEGWSEQWAHFMPTT